MMQKGAFWALNKGIQLDASKKPKEKAKAAEYFQASAELYEKVLNSTNPKFPGEESWAAATFKNVGIAYGRLQHIAENSGKMAVAFETYLARSDPTVDPADQRFEMHRCELQRAGLCGSLSVRDCADDNARSPPSCVLCVQAGIQLPHDGGLRRFRAH